MPKNSDHFAAMAGGAAGFIAMAVIGWNFAGGAALPVAGNSQDAAASAHRDRPARAQRSSGVSSAAVQQLAAIRSGRNPTERMRATIDLANSLAPSDFAAWLDGGWFSLRDGAELTLFTKIVEERWKLEDPGGYAAWMMKRNPSEAARVLASWAEKDPQRVADFFKLQADSKSEIQILRQLAKDQPALTLKCLRDLNATSFSGNGSYDVGDILRQIVQKSPAEVEAFVGELSGQVKLQAEVILIGEKMKTDYAGELGKLWGRPDGLRVFQNLENATQGKIFDELANLPPDWRAALVSNPGAFMDRKSAAKWMNADLMAMGFSEKDEKTILERAMSLGARENPADAFKLMAELNQDEDERRSVIGNALSGQRDQADSIIALLTSESDREIARSIVDQRSASNSPQEKIETPAQWLEKVASIDPEARDSYDSYQYASIVGNWDAAKVSAFSEQFKSLPADKKLVIAQTIAGGNYTNYYAPAVAGDAIRYLITNPPTPNPDGKPKPREFDVISRASGYAGNLAAKDPETASQWVGSLPEGDAKAWSQLNLRAVWSEYDPKAAEQWFKTLPAATQTQVLNLATKPAH